MEKKGERGGGAFLCFAAAATTAAAAAARALHTHLLAWNGMEGKGREGTGMERSKGSCFKFFPPSLLPCLLPPPRAGPDWGRGQAGQGQQP